jgi:hypothetical protein
MRNLAISALRLAGRTDITEATRWAAGPWTGHLPSSASPDQVARGNRRGQQGRLAGPADGYQAQLPAPAPADLPRARRPHAPQRPA